MSKPTAFHTFSSSILKSSQRSTDSIPKEVPFSIPNYAFESLIEGCYNQLAETNFHFQTEFQLESAQKWIKYPGKHQVKFPLQTVEPKVQMLRNVPLKTIPRDVVVDRLRKQYGNVKIGDLLLNAGISNSNLMSFEKVQKELVREPLKCCDFISLHAFDDETFDSNTATGWLEKGTVDGHRHPLPAYALVESEIGVYSWEIVAVYGYDESSSQFSVIDLKEANTHQVYRIHLMFLAENPHNFLNRIKFALEQRKESEAIIRHQMLLDCVLYDQVPEMPKNFRTKIIKLSVKDKKTYDNIVVQSLCNEVRLNFQRALVSLEFKDVLQETSDFPYIKIIAKKHSWDKMVSNKTTKTQQQRFERSKNNFRLFTLFYTRQSIDAMSYAVFECTHIESLCLYSKVFINAVSLSDFVNTQETICNSVVKFLKYTWPETLSGKICLCLRSIGKGWLDLSIADWNIFKIAKISRFFLQTKFRMQESLQVLMEKSILNYSRLLNDPCSDFLYLDNDYIWINDFRTTPFDRLNLSPVFKLTLQVGSEAPFYSTDPKEFEPTVTNLLYTTLMSTCGIRNIEPDSLQNMSFDRNLYIFTIELIEDMYNDHVARLHASYAKALIPLNAYLEKYKRFVEFHELVVNEYIEEFSKAEKSSQEIKNEIIWQKEQKEELKTILPDQIVIGPFQIFVEPLKTFLINKRIEIIRKLFLYFVERMYNINEELLDELLEINGKLHEKLLSIEHLFEMKNYMTMVPEKLILLGERIKIMMLEYNILDSFFYNLNDQQFSMKWEAFGWPQKILNRLIAMKEEHKTDIEQFQEIQISELALFQERLESLNEEIMAFSLQFDPEKALEVAVEAKKTWKLITDLQKHGRILQQRQVLFEGDALSLDYLERIIESFNPYRFMWTSCSDFIKLEEITVGNPIATIDLKEIRDNIEEIRIIFEKSIEIFSEKEEIQNIAKVFLANVEKFYPTLEALECIKDENWLIVHWQEFAQRSSIDIKFSTAMNFSYCIKKGILNHVPLLKEIAKKAVLEADEIRFAMEEEERLRIETELALLEKKKNRKCRTDIL